MSVVHRLKPKDVPHPIGAAVNKSSEYQKICKGGIVATVHIQLVEKTGFALLNYMVAI